MQEYHEWVSCNIIVWLYVRLVMWEKRMTHCMTYTKKWSSQVDNCRREYIFFKLLMSLFHLYLPFFYSFLIMFLPAIIFAFVLAFSFKHWLFIPRARYDWNLKEKIMKIKSWLIQVKVTNAFQHFAVGCFQSKSHHSSQLERLRQLRKGPLRATMHI